MVENMMVIERDGQSVFLHSMCGTDLVRKPGDSKKEEKPWVLYCPTCRIVAYDWDTKEERERALSAH